MHDKPLIEQPFGYVLHYTLKVHFAQSFFEDIIFI